MMLVLNGTAPDYADIDRRIAEAKEESEYFERNRTDKS